MTLHFPAYSTDVSNAPRQVTVPKPQSATPRAGATLYSKYFKSVLDRGLVIIALPVVLPLVALSAMLIAMDGRNPFYSQMRVGRRGRTFRMWKLRTMVHNADFLLETYLAADPQLRHEWQTTQKLKSDPRITYIGRFLRKTSIDELPQLLNVLNGTMSLVGPRPIMTSQQSSYFGKRYTELRPGLTGPWQISDRNHCEFQDRAHFDDVYYNEISLKTDVSIILKTVRVVVKATGY